MAAAARASTESLCLPHGDSGSWNLYHMFLSRWLSRVLIESREVGLHWYSDMGWQHCKPWFNLLWLANKFCFSANLYLHLLHKFFLEPETRAWTQPPPMTKPRPTLKEKMLLLHWVSFPGILFSELKCENSENNVCEDQSSLSKWSPRCSQCCQSCEIMRNQCEQLLTPGKFSLFVISVPTFLFTS